MSRTSWCICVALIVLNAGCASFRGGELPDVGPQALAGLSSPHEASVDVLFTSLGNRSYPAENLFSRRVDMVFSPVFKSVAFSQDGQGFVIRLNMANKGNVGLAAISGFLCGFSLFTIPGYARDDYILNVDVRSPDGTSRQYVLRDHVSTWIHLFMVVMMPGHGTNDVLTQTWDNMLRTLLVQMKNDGLLSAP